MIGPGHTLAAAVQAAQQGVTRRPESFGTESFGSERPGVVKPKPLEPQTAEDVRVTEGTERASAVAREESA